MEMRLITHLDQALAAIEAGESIETRLAQYPDEATELATLLQIALALKTLPQSGPSAATIRAAKKQFLAEAERRRASANGSLRAQLSQRFSIPAWVVPARVLAAVVIALALVLVSSSGVIYAASGSLPGDPLYGVKRLGEDIRYTLTLKHDSRIRLEGTFTERRRVEVQQLLSRGRQEQVLFGGILREQSEDTWWVEGIPVTVNAYTLVQDKPSTNIFVEVRGTTQAEGTVLAQLVEVEGDEVIGLVEVLNQDDWQIAGQRIQVDDRTDIDGQLQVGDCAEVHARRFPDGTLLALEIERTEECSEDDSDKDTDNDDGEEYEATPTVQPSPTPTAPPPNVSPTPTDEIEEGEEEQEEKPTPTVQPSPTPTQDPGDDGDDGEDGGEPDGGDDSAGHDDDDDDGDSDDSDDPDDSDDGSDGDDGNDGDEEKDNDDE